MVRIIDRRFDSKKKSAVNRQRFMRRFKHQIRRAVSDAIGGRSIRDVDSGENISIPSKDLSEPHFQHGEGGVWETVFSGNDRFSSGDRINRPPPGGGQGGGSSASNEGEGEDDFVFQLNREEFLDLFFEDLELPNLIRTQLAQLVEYKSHRAGFTNDGVPANINIIRSLRGASVAGSHSARHTGPRFANCRRNSNRSARRWARATTRCANSLRRSPACARVSRRSHSSTAMTCATTTGSRCPSRRPAR